MPDLARSIFLSYSSRDYFFAEMLAIKLREVNFDIRRDQGSIRHLTDEMLEDLIRSRPDMFRHATIKGGKQGIAKRVP